MTVLSFHRWSRAGGNSPEASPQRAVLYGMLDEIALFLDATGVRPVAMATASWPRPAHFPREAALDVLCLIQLTVEPGEMRRSFRSWYQWEHPRWHWSREPFPDRVQIDAGLAPASSSEVRDAGEGMPA